jgi:TusA-related sulfurtransferase
MIKLDCFGDICPVPLLKIKHKLADLNEGDSIMVVVDHSCVAESIHDFYKNSAHDIEIEEVMNGVWEITLTKHSPL